MLFALVRALRPAQWAKNLFVLAPVVFAQKLLEPHAAGRAALAFVAFCAASSAIYLLNDLRDREEDRRHPVKSLRPIASGALPVSVAAASALILAVAAVSLCAWMGLPVLILVVLYLVLNLGYSFGLKHVVILDVLIVSIGFVLRVMVGADAIAVRISSWLLLCTIFLALFLAVSKRRHELVLLAGSASSQRKVLDAYSPQLLDQMINVVTASAVVSYALYTLAPETVARFHTNHLVYTVPLVLFGVFRYLYLIYQRSDQRNPTEAILADGPFLINLLLWGLAVLWIVYLS